MAVLGLNDSLSLTAEKTGMLPTWALWIMQPRQESRINNRDRLQDNKCLPEQFDGVCSSMDSQLEGHGCGYP
ncbi:hypothetical protein TNCV_991 [Trichonephila clavipes]|nr:hypothetical protein TNCV_991 [Trichonephila clavipes]